MRGHAKVVGLITVAVCVTAAVCGSGVLLGRWAFGVVRDLPEPPPLHCDHVPGPDPSVRNDPAVVHQKLPALGELAEVRFIELDVSVDECTGEKTGPARYRLLGFATPAPGGVDALRREYPFEPVTAERDGPPVPYVLRPAEPPGPRWLRGPALERRIGGTLCRVWLDEVNGVLFVEWEQ